MKFRRHEPYRRDWKRWLRGAATPLTSLTHLVHLERVPKLFGRDRLSKHTRVAVWLGSAIAAFALGYVIAALALFPAPIFAATVAVPRVIGITQADAERTLNESELMVGGVRAENHPTAARGDVFWQDPPPGVGVPRGHEVDLTVSAGPQRIPVPDLTGYDAAVAEQLVLAAGLVVGRRETTQAPAPRGAVINTRPPAGTTLLPGTEVTLVVSVGAPTITVPRLVGLTRAEADSVLVEVGLSLGTTVRRTTSDAPPGSIVAQNPAPGTLSAPGTAVNLTLARERNR